MDFARTLLDRVSTLRTHAVGRYALALAGVLAVVALRALFDPALAPGAYYYLYLPVIVLLAYTLGLGPSLFAVLVGGLISYYAFSEPAWSVKPDLRANLRVLMFFASGAAIAYVVAQVRDRLSALTGELAQVSSLSSSQAELFREHATRVGDHLQLISALLQAKAAEEPGTDYSRVLMNAASRTMLISRIHRSFMSSEGQQVDFAAFANRLVDAALEARGRPPLILSIEGELELAPEQATSLAVILLEWLGARAAQKPRGIMRITLDRHGPEATLTIAEDEISRDDLRKRGLAVIGAIAEQMKGSVVLGGSGDRGLLRFVFPTELQPLPKWDPLAAFQ